MDLLCEATCPPVIAHFVGMHEICRKKSLEKRKHAKRRPQQNVSEKSGFGGDFAIWPPSALQVVAGEMVRPCANWPAESG